MNLQLSIKNQVVEIRYLDMEGIDLIDQRERIVYEQTLYLKQKYYRDIALSREWEIILTAKSKMNELHRNARIEE